MNNKNSPGIKKKKKRKGAQGQVVIKAKKKQIMKP